MRRRVLGVVAGAVISLAAPTAAQSPLTLAARVDAAFPSGDFGDVASAGTSISASTALTLIPGLGIYGRYTRADFALEAMAVAVTDSGISVGLITALPIYAFGADTPWWVSGGAVFHDLDMESGGVSVGADSEVGFELSTGAAVSIAPRLRLMP